MARLPRYEAGRVQAAGIGQIDFAGMREQARFSESIGKMAAFVNREVQEREIKRTREEEEQNATYQRIQADTLKTALFYSSQRYQLPRPNNHQSLYRWIKLLEAWQT